MNLIPHSNGLKKIKMKKEKTKSQRLKNIANIIVGFFLLSFLFQTVSNFIGNEKIESRLNYAKIDNKKMEYEVSGSGDYTIIFDGSIGANLYEWSETTKSVEKELGVKTFVYNRNGYGFNENAEMKTPNEQAQDLKILLRKAGVSGNLILVGEEYGSLVMTNFAKLYPESISGLMLIKPFSEDIIKDEEFKDSIKGKYYKSKVESMGASVGLTTLMDKLNLAISVDGFEENLPRGADEEFSIQKNQKRYRQAINNELEALYKYNEESQVEGLVAGKPLYIISNDGADPLSKLGSLENTNIYVTESDKVVMSLTDTESVFTGISYIVREAKKIERKNNK
ncbi:alpha/beta hydrolase [Clostridium vincentii]|uniref:Alpha/beta hydrolase family protein n=1 Tax=Clostridium vincentii TaxID=52704 RepID=A0A2T0BH50_9CLOT|nr:alpha/beta hydrolase [Clostridium vincentii]PRR83195.1 Alpha/beta hydrolase family protein [Clostridium vincentii]